MTTQHTTVWLVYEPLKSHRNIMMTFTEVDVFIGNNTLIDPDIYQYWLDGYSGNCLFYILLNYIYFHLLNSTRSSKISERQRDINFRKYS